MSGKNYHVWTGSFPEAAQRGETVNSPDNHFGLRKQHSGIVSTTCIIGDEKGSN
jgi:hypothetical protein